MSGGIIRGFLGGGGKALAQAGQMLFADQIAQESAEAEDLRTRALRTEDREAEQAFRTSEREAGEKYKTETAETKAKTDSVLQSQRDTAAMERAELAASSKSPKNPQLIKYTDSKGNEQEGVLRTNQDGSFTVVKPDGVTTIEEGIKPSTSDIAQAAKEYKQQAKLMESDKSQFGMSEAKWKKKRAVEIAMERQSGSTPRPTPQADTGIIGGQMGSTTEKKSVGGRNLTKQEFIDAMVGRYGEDKMPDIEETWASIQ